MPKFKSALNAYQSKVFLGHNWAATKGVVNNVNAHPYEVDHIVGAHNNTLDSISYANLEKLLNKKFNTDNHAIITNITKFNIEKIIPILHSKTRTTNGTWSLV